MKIALIGASGRRARAISGTPAVSIIRPVCGLENFIDETLASSFRLDYARYEVIFCVAQARDAAAPPIEPLEPLEMHVKPREVP